jgi:hypothetical protein
MKNRSKIVLALIGIVFILCLIPSVVNFTDHLSFKTVNKLTLLDGDSIVFIPAGSFVLGNAYECIEIDGHMIDQSKIPENEKINKETLIKVNYKCVVYFENQEKEALELLGN